MILIFILSGNGPRSIASTPWPALLLSSSQKLPEKSTLRLTVIPLSSIGKAKSAAASSHQMYDPIESFLMIPHVLSTVNPENMGEADACMTSLGCAQ